MSKQQNYPSWKNAKVQQTIAYSVMGRVPTKKNASKQQEKNSSSDLSFELSYKVNNLVNNLRRYGYLATKLDPLGFIKTTIPQELLPETYGIHEKDLVKEIIFENKTASVLEIISHYKKIYSSFLGLEFSHIRSKTQRLWLQEQMEKPVTFDSKDKINALQHLIDAYNFEKIFDIKFPGTKRFGLLGNESTILVLHDLLKIINLSDTKEVIMGVAHRGRLNIMANILNKPLDSIFAGFSGKFPTYKGIKHFSGDVKYHESYSNIIEIDGKKIKIKIPPNPSHLEAVDPVAMGITKAKCDNTSSSSQAKTILIHGDGSFVGQGIVAESNLLAKIDAYKSNGVIHLIINNQLGFTADHTVDRGNLKYASDGSKGLMPIIHVNGENIEACLKATRIAADYSTKFAQDILIDLYGYRLHGHNEGDDPTYTQPVLYKTISKHQNIAITYGNTLVEKGILNEKDLDIKLKQSYQKFEEGYNKREQYKWSTSAPWLKEKWSKQKPYNPKDDNILTGIELSTYDKLTASLFSTPDNFTVHPKLSRQFSKKQLTFKEGTSIDWGSAELLALASLLNDGYSIRFSGEDTQRGTFSSRNATLVDYNTKEKYTPISKFTTKENRINFINSPISEFACLGFEYGYSTVDPKVFVAWEAQFGDFANGAQTIFDQFISASVDKWLLLSGLVILLPHGLEGQGSEHSSARMRRYLNLFAQNNLRVANVTTPANYFHILRRQMVSAIRIPLILMTPKSLLRNKMCISPRIDFLAKTKFQTVLRDKTVKPSHKIDRIIICSGKVYYDLINHKIEHELNNNHIIRIEQLAPFPNNKLRKLLSEFDKNVQIIWSQEEPLNYGAYNFVNAKISALLIKLQFKNTLQVVSRTPSPSPATGYGGVHVIEQQKIIKKTFNIGI